MRVLDLFCGTKSVTSYCESHGWEVMSLDILPKYNPTFCTDILDFDYTQFPPGHFDIIWASPECKVFSQLQTSNIGRFKYKTLDELNAARKRDSIYVARALRLIEYLKPKLWFVENPRYSKIWDYVQTDMEYYFVDVDYCKFGCVYRKRTRIMTNRPREGRLCDKRKHEVCLGYSGAVARQRGNENDLTQTKRRYAVPRRLLEYLLTAAE